jgi:7-cyano-7-deazaguanine reductase
MSEELSILGSGVSRPSKALETFPNRNPGRFYLVQLHSDEFTCVCPQTGQPDFATIRVRYVPDASVVESKSFKLYLWSYREEGVFHEHVVNTILDDIISAAVPHWCEVVGDFSVRGGVSIIVTAEQVRTAEARAQWR